MFQDDIFFYIWLPFNAADSKIDSYYVLSEGKKRSDSFLYIDILCAEGRTTEQKINCIFQCPDRQLIKQIFRQKIFLLHLKKFQEKNWSFRGEGTGSYREKRKISYSWKFRRGNIEWKSCFRQLYERYVIWRGLMDETLDQKTRSFITLTALAAIGNTEQMKFHIQTAYKTESNERN